MQRGRRLPYRLCSTARVWTTTFACASALLIGALPAVAQDDDDAPADDGGSEFDELADVQGDFDAVRAVDRDAPPGTPLISNKLFPMGGRVELSAAFDYSYGNKFVSQTGGHVSVGFHLLDWVSIEAFGGAFYPQELAITKTVRQQGRSFTDFGEEPALSDLWQSFAFAGADVHWSPLYGKLSFFSEQDLSFQLYFFGGGAIEGIAKPDDAADGGVINNQRDFYPGLISGKQFSYMVRPSLNYGAGVRLIPWSWLSLRIELRNFTGLNPSVDEPGGEYDDLDFSHLPMLTLSVGFMTPNFW